MKTWWFKDLRNIFFVWGAVFILCCLFTVIMMKMDVSRFYIISKSSKPFYELAFAPIVEEFIFRWIWISLAMWTLSKEGFKRIRWHLAALLSIIFAVAHYGYFSIFIQGVFGMGACYLYYKNRFGYLSAVLCHSLWNIMLGVVLPNIINMPTPNPWGF